MASRARLLCCTALVTALAALLCEHRPAQAQNVWMGTGSDANWTTSGNFTSPVTNDQDLVFQGSQKLSNVNDVLGLGQINSLTFNANAGAFVLSGLATTIGGGGVTNFASSTQTLAFNDVRLASSQLWFAQAGSLVVTAPVTMVTASANVILSISGGRDVSIAGAVAEAGGPSFSGGIVKDGAGTLTLRGSNSYTAGTTINFGTLAISQATGLGTGLVILNGGTLRTFDADFIVSNAIDVASSGGTIETQSNATLSGIISGPGSLTKTGSGTLTLNGTNTYASTVLTQGVLVADSDAALGTAGGLLTLNGGVLRSAGTTIARDITLGTGGGTVDTSGTLTISGDLSGVTNDGGLSKTGTGTLILSGGASYAGATTILGGTLQISRADALSLDSAIAVSSGATLAIDPAQTVLGAGLTGAGSVTIGSDSRLIIAVPDGRTDTFSGTITGAGAFEKEDPGTLILTGTGHAIGDELVVCCGVLELQGGTFTAGAGALVEGGTLKVTQGGLLSASDFGVNGNVEISGSARIEISGETQLGVLGMEQITLSAGGVLASAGDASIAPLLAPTTVSITGAGSAWTVGGALDIGNGSGAGNQVTLADGGALSVTGLLTIDDASTLTLGSGAAAGTVGASAIVNQGLIAADFTGALALAMAISGDGELTKAGAGTLTLSGSNTYSGMTTVTGGTLAVTGSLGSGAVVIASGATLAGTGTIGGAVTLADGAFLAPGASPGTLSLGALTLNNASRLTYELATPGSVGAGVNDLVSVTGGLTLDGVLDITPLAGFGTGSYRLFDYGSLVADNGLAFGNVPAGYDFALSTATPGEVNLAVTFNGLQFWNGTRTTPNGTVNGGSGTWTSGTTNWTDAAGSVAQTWNGLTAVFAGAAGTVNLASNQQVAGLQFATSGYVLSGSGALELTAPSTEMRIDAGLTATLDTIVTGAGGVTKTGAGTIVLTRANTYGGGTALNAGTLSIASDLNLGAALTGVTFNGGTLATSLSLATGRLFTFNAAGTLDVAAATTLTLNGGTAGTGSLTKSGAGTLVLTSNAAHSGGTVIAAGALRVGAGGTQGTLAGPVLNDGALVFDRSDSITFAGTLSGAGTLEQAGSGTLVLAGDAAPGGGTTISAGTIQVGAGGTVGTLAGAVANAGALVFDRADASVFSGAVTGAGTVTKQGAGTLAVTGTLAHAGGTAISSGTLQIGTGGTSGEITGAVVNAGTLAFARTDTVTFAGSISGTGRLVQAGPGTLILTGANSLSGGTAIAAGATLQIGAGGTVGSFLGDIATDGTLAFNRADAVTLSGTVSGAGTLAQIGPGRLTLTAANSHAGGTLVANGILQISSDANLGTASGPLTLQGGTLATTQTLASARPVTLAGSGGTFEVAAGTVTTLAGAVTGAGGLTKTGAGTLVLATDTRFSGATTISAGTLQVGTGGTSGAIDGTVVNNGALIFNRSDSYSVTAAISGTGTVDFIGGGTASFAANGSFSGPVSVANGTVTLADSRLANAAFTIGAGGFLKGNGTIGSLTVGAGGRVGPGNSPGVIAVNGALSFAAGSTYQVDVTPTGAHDLLTAGGPVSISTGAAVEVLAAPARYAPNVTYTILTTAGVLEGAFGSVTSSFAFLDPSLSYDAQNVYLTLIYNGVSFAALGRTPNQIDTGSGAQALGFGNPVFDALVTLPAAGVPAALDALSGEAYASVDTVLQQQSSYVREAVGARLRQSITPAGGGPLALASAAGAPLTARLGGLTPTLWAQGYGGWGNSFGNGNAASISNAIGGFLIGADVALGPDARAGVFGGFSQSQFDVDARASLGSSDNYDLGIYAGARFGALALRGGAAYGWHDISLQRSIAFPGFAGTTEGGFQTETAQVFGELGYDVSFGAMAFEPFAGLAYVHAGGGTLQEAPFGAGGAALAVSLGAMDTLYSTLGLRAATSIAWMGRPLTPSVTLGWQHAFGDTDPSATMRFLGGTAPFAVSGVPIATDVLLVGGGLAYGLSERATLSVAYNGQFAPTAAQTTLTAQFSLRF